jgi:hypothetical protein
MLRKKLIKMNKKRRAAMEMSVGTLVTIVLLMIVLGLGIVLIQKIFGGATASVDNINNQVTTQINNLFNSENKDLVVSLGEQQTAKVKQGTKNFGFVVGYAPEDPTGLGACTYSITLASGSYCKSNTVDPLTWIKTGTNSIKFSEVQGNVAYELIKLNVPETLAPCVQRFLLKTNCGAQSSTFFDIEVVKKGFL